MPRLQKTDRKRLDALAEAMIAEASPYDSPRILSSNGFSRSSISILHQQQRCTNLAWALKFTERVKTGDVIGIVGGSFSGIMLASALAMCNEIIVYLFEKEHRLMQRFLGKSHRFIAPNLNSRSLRSAFHPTQGPRVYNPPLFDWEGDAASIVAMNWRNQFRGYAEKLPIFYFLGHEVKPQHIEATPRSVTIQFEPLDNGVAVHPIKIDWLIDATGFGPEGNPFKLNDYSYWESGHRLMYDYLGPKTHVLVSGCGDSGTIEMMHYAIKHFSHAHVDAFWPPPQHLDIYIDEQLEMSAFDDVTDCEDDYDLEELPLNSELRWFRGVCRRGAEGYFGGPDDLDRARRRVFDAIEKALFEWRVQPSDWHAYFDLVPHATAQKQAAVRAAASPILDEESSIAIHKAMQNIDITKLFDVKVLHDLRRTDVTVVLNGVTPTPFTRQLSPFNVWLMHVMLSFPNVSYRQGRLDAVHKQPDGTRQVRFEDGTQETFDRVVTRYGPGIASHLTQPRCVLDPAGYLLVSPCLLIKNGDGERYVDLAKLEVERARNRLAKRRVSRAPEHHINKCLFAQAVQATEDVWPKSIQNRQYSQVALVSLLKEGVRPSFSEYKRW